MKTNGPWDTELLNSDEICLPVEVPSLNFLPFPVPYNRVVFVPTTMLHGNWFLPPLQGTAWLHRYWTIPVCLQTLAVLIAWEKISGLSWGDPGRIMWPLLRPHPFWFLDKEPTWSSIRIPKVLHKVGPWERYATSHKNHLRDLLSASRILGTMWGTNKRIR